MNAIGGVGFFSSHTRLPVSIAWDAFGRGNGCNSFNELRRMILGYRCDKYNENPEIGCVILTNPIFFQKEDWISVPGDWSKSIVQGKSYSTESEIGKTLLETVEARIHKYLMHVPNESKNQLILDQPEARYGKSILQKVRLGQGAFRMLVTDAYERRCSISGEKTLPVLEAAHIKPYAESGPHFISNSLLLRSDLHKLFDAGYLTITQNLKIEVSKRIREEFQNGKEYYQFHGNSLQKLPSKILDNPNVHFLKWHNENRFNG